MNPLYLLAGGAVVHFGYTVFPPDVQALAWNAAGAAARLILLAMVVVPVTSPYVAAVAAWLVAEEAQVIVCNAAFAVSPWVVLPDQDMCSSWIQTDLGKVSAVVVAAILLAITSNVGSFGGRQKHG